MRRERNFSDAPSEPFRYAGSGCDPRVVKSIVALASAALIVAGCAGIAPTPFPTPYVMPTNPIAQTPRPPFVTPSSRTHPIKLGASGTAEPLTLQVDTVSFDARKIAHRGNAVFTPAPGERLVAIKMTVEYPGDQQWGFNNSALDVIGRSGVVYPPDGLCQPFLPESPLTNGTSVLGVHKLSGWAACWRVNTGDVASLVLRYEPPYFVLSPGQPKPAIWFALR
jgi:hypothetical protein